MIKNERTRAFVQCNILSYVQMSVLLCSYPVSDSNGQVNKSRAQKDTGGLSLCNKREMDNSDNGKHQKHFLCSVQSAGKAKRHQLSQVLCLERHDPEFILHLWLSNWFPTLIVNRTGFQCPTSEYWATEYKTQLSILQPCFVQSTAWQ